jgi:hypothetical protein
MQHVPAVRREWEAGAGGQFLSVRRTAERSMPGVIMAHVPAVMRLLLPTSGRDNHATLRNHTISVGRYIQGATRPNGPSDATEVEAELGIDVGYVRQVKNVSRGNDRGIDSSSIAVVVSVVGRVGKPPRVWASALPRSRLLHMEMCKLLKDSGYEPMNRVCVLSDGARDLAAIATALPHASRWVLDWAHIGRMFQYVDQAIAPLAYGHLTPPGSVFELRDIFVRFRSWVRTGETDRWQVAGPKLCDYLLCESKVTQQR